MKTEERTRARQLRAEQGLSVRDIAREVGCARSTASRWVRDVPLTDHQRERLTSRDPTAGGRLLGAARNAELGRARRMGYQDDGRALARKGDAHFVAGLMLYWAEGSKTLCHSAALTNSDSALLRYFTDWLREWFDIADGRLRVHCNMFADSDTARAEIERHWLRELELPDSCLTRSSVNQPSKQSRGKRAGLLPFGTCRVSVHSTRVVQMIFGGIQEVARVDRPEWVG